MRTDLHTDRSDASIASPARTIDTPQMCELNLTPSNFTPVGVTTTSFSYGK
jgi:hypothetical protein